ncbi:ROK family transcriptional regulator [Parafrankia sp. BMG5.11]|uniref:ROK family transcriptional regulator n=1 Tax=Parafrankia sp. BMG5.11 TaxID=222540 RepID=UPI001AA00BF7|nr:ROK family transcriptional regulator [Parafrankia sp. BMG5.11]
MTVDGHVAAPQGFVFMPRTPPGSQSSLRAANRDRVLGVLRREGSLAQAEIARLTGLSPATVSNIVGELRESGDVDARPAVSGGRRAVRVSLSRRSGVVIGLDFGHRHLRVAIGDLAHEVLAEDVVDIDVDHQAQEGIATAGRLVDDLLGRLTVDRADVVGVGMGLPGPIDAVTGAVGSSAILPGWVGVPAAAQMSERLGLPVRVDNDANLGALAELHWGAGQGVRDLAYLKASTGVGSGLVIDGRVHRGGAGTAGEIEHTTLDENGSVCRCGNRGCLETIVGTSVLLESLRTSHGPDLTVRGMIDRAVAGDAGCARVVSDAGRAIGNAAANLCNLLNPQMIVVGGDLAAAGETLLEPMRQVVHRFAVPAAVPTIVAGVLGERAEVLGALALVLREGEPIPR